MFGLPAPPVPVQINGVRPHPPTVQAHKREPEPEKTAEPDLAVQTTLVGVPFPQMSDEPPTPNERPRLTPVRMEIVQPELTPEPRVPIGVDSALQRERARALLRGIEKGPDRPPAASVRTEPGGPRAKRRRRARFATGLVIAGALAVALPAAIYGIRKYAGPKTPAEARTALGSGVAMLRKDDETALARATALFSQLSEAYPAYVDAKANRALALALQLDNLQLEAARIRREADEKSKLKSRVEATKSPIDWQSRANALKDEVTDLEKERGILEKRIGQTRKQLALISHELDSSHPDEEEPILRARVVVQGVNGDPQVIPLAERYRSRGGIDGWATIALAEYAANTMATPDTIAQVQEQLEVLRRADPAFMRAHVLAARLAIAQRKFGKAAEILEAVVAMNPSHEQAANLRAQAQRRASRAGP